MVVVNNKCFTGGQGVEFFENRWMFEPWFDPVTSRMSNTSIFYVLIIKDKFIFYHSFKK